MKNNRYCFDSGDTSFDSLKTQLRALKKINDDEINILMTSMPCEHFTQCQSNHLHEYVSNSFALKDNCMHSQHANTNNNTTPHAMSNNTNNHVTKC